MPEPMETVEEVKISQETPTPPRKSSDVSSKSSSSNNPSPERKRSGVSKNGSAGKQEPSRKDSAISKTGSASSKSSRSGIGEEDHAKDDESEGQTTEESKDSHESDGDRGSREKSAGEPRSTDGDSPTHENGTAQNEAVSYDEQRDNEHRSTPDLLNRGDSRATSRSSTASPGLPSKRFKVTLLYPLEKQYACPACQEIFRYPIKLNDCGHRVCSPCFYEIQRVEPRCPIDQNRIARNKCMLDMEFNKEIQALDVKCNSHEWGCKWEGQLKEGQAHDEICDYADALCINDCGIKFQRRFLQKHLEKDCPKKIIPCPFCDERHLREDKKLHLEECINIPLPCPNKCDKKLLIPRNKLDKHIEEECPRTKVMCQYEEIGCSYRANRDKLSKHYKSGMVDHVAFIYNFTMEQTRRIDHHDNQLQDHLNVLENHQQRLGDLERLSRNQLIWRIDDYSRKCKEAKAGNTTTLFSPVFMTSKHGYRLVASVCLNGDGKGKGTHLSVFVSILKGAYDSLLKWPFDYRVTFYLLDQNDDINERKHIKFSIKPNPCPSNGPFLRRPEAEKNASFGGAKFTPQEEVRTRNYLRDDAIFIKVVVDCDGSTEP